MTAGYYEFSKHVWSPAPNKLGVWVHYQGYTSELLTILISGDSQSNMKIALRVPEKLTQTHKQTEIPTYNHTQAHTHIL
jgi:hypothetical protein